MTQRAPPTCIRQSAMYSGFKHVTPWEVASETSTLKSPGFSRLKSANRWVVSLYKDGDGLGSTCRQKSQLTRGTFKERNVPNIKQRRVLQHQNADFWLGYNFTSCATIWLWCNWSHCSKFKFLLKVVKSFAHNTFIVETGHLIVFNILLTSYLSYL